MRFKATHFLSIPSIASLSGVLLTVIGVICRYIDRNSLAPREMNQTLDYLYTICIFVPTLTLLGHTLRARQLYAFAIYLTIFLFPTQAAFADLHKTIKVFTRLGLASNVLIMLGMLIGMTPILEFRLWKYDKLHSSVPLFSTALLYIISGGVESKLSVASSAVSILVGAAAIIGVSKRSLSIVLCISFYSINVVISSLPALFSAIPKADTKQAVADGLRFIGALVWICWYSFHFSKYSVQDHLMGDIENDHYAPLP